MPDLPRDDVSRTPDFYTRTMRLPHPDETENFLIDIPRDGCVLDLGCGTGRFAAAFKRDRPDLVVDALERHSQGCALARRHEGIQVLQQSIQSLSAQQRYDAVWAYNVLFFDGNELSAMLDRIHAALKQEGKLDFTYIALQPEGRHKIFNFDARTAEELQTMLYKAGFEVEYFQQREDLPYQPSPGMSKIMLPSFHITARKVADAA